MRGMSGVPARPYFGNCSFEANVAEQTGGGVHIAGTGSFVMVTCTFLRNECGSEGCSIDFDSSGFLDEAARPHFRGHNRFVAGARGLSTLRYTGLVGWECIAGHYAARTGTLQGSFDGCPLSCSAGTFASGESAALDPCVACAAGKYQDLTGATSCKECVPGSYCPRRASLPLSCPSGTFGPTSRLKTRGECTACPRGKSPLTLLTRLCIYLQRASRPAPCFTCPDTP